MAVKDFKFFLFFVFGALLFGVSYFLSVANAADINATITTGIFVPDAPINLAVTIGDRSVDLSWSSPISNGGSAITDYVVQYKLSSGGVWAIFSDGVSTSTFVTVTSLSNDNSYDFRVSAVNVMGQSLPSTSVTATPGPPAQVLISTITDATTPSIVSAVTITNEGGVAYEYQYTWCVTTAETNLCGGGDDVFMSSAAKLIQPAENWNTSLDSTVSSAGDYWFHLEVQFGSDTSYAVQSFTATNPSSSSGGGGGGGSSSGSKKSTQCVGADLNKDKIVNLIDFSILMVFFGTLPPYKNTCADINGDKKVSIVDFSIMLNQWGKKPVVFKL